MQNQLQRILNLVNRTGDKMVIFDDRTDQSYVVMELDQYESLVELGEINNFEDIDDFENFDEFDKKEKDEFYGMPGDNFNNNKEKYEDIPEVNLDEWNDDEKVEDNYVAEEEFLPKDSQYYQNEPKLDINDDYGKIEQKRPQKRWEIPKEVKNTEFEEENDRYYLEHI